MLNNFIGGGQVFLHKVRMFWQVFTRTIHIALLLGIIAACSLYGKEIQILDWPAVYSYGKAILADEFDGAMNGVRISIGKKPTHITFINARSKSGTSVTNVDPRKIRYSYGFTQLNKLAIELGRKILIWSGVFTSLVFLTIFLVWSRFGKALKDEKTKDGANKILTAKEVRKALHKIKRASDLKIGDMPLVKDMETMNLLVSGAIGSGKTNLMHNLLPQVESRSEPAIIIDNTGEMIAKYYNPERGDIIFNPFDKRSHSWDFWHDCTKEKDLEKFADILIGFNSRKNNRAANDFWEASAQSVFVACTRVLQQYKQHSIQELYNTLTTSEAEEMYSLLQGTDASKYFTKDNAKTAASIISVLMANIKPMKFLKDNNAVGSFSIENHINNVNTGSKSWLFLSTDPSARELTTALNAALLELFISRMRKTRTKTNNKIWIVMDELPSLGKLPSLPQLMAEGRKYGSCVLAGLQSTSQLYQHYGDAEASSLIGLFKTKFAFASDDPRMGELYSKLCGNKTSISQQKNTSFGANEFRDGVSYNERREQLPLVPYEEFTRLSTGQCYVILPETSVRIAKIQTPESKLDDKNKWFTEDTENTDLPHTSKITMKLPKNSKVKKAKELATTIPNTLDKDSPEFE